MSMPAVCGSGPGGRKPGRARGREPGNDLTAPAAARSIFRLMSELSTSRVPETLDAWRMVAARREFEGRVLLSAMARLRDSLVDAEGEVRYVLAFDTDAARHYAELAVTARAAGTTGVAAEDAGATAAAVAGIAAGTAAAAVARVGAAGATGATGTAVATVGAVFP